MQKGVFQKMKKQDLTKKNSGFQRSKDLRYFLLEVINLILSRGYFYCFCEEFKGHSTEFNGPQQCTLCFIFLIFNNFEKKKKKDFNQHNWLF